MVMVMMMMMMLMCKENLNMSTCYCASLIALANASRDLLSDLLFASASFHAVADSMNSCMASSVNHIRCKVSSQRFHSSNRRSMSSSENRTCMRGQQRKKGFTSQWGF